MRTPNPNLLDQVIATNKEKQRERPRGSRSLYVEEPKFTSTKESALHLAQPQPNKNHYKATKISQGFARMNLKASQENRTPTKPISQKSAVESNVTDPGEVDYGDVLAAGVYRSTRPPQKSKTPSQSGPMCGIPNIKKGSPSHHEAQGSVCSDSDDSRHPSRKSTRVKDGKASSVRVQNQEIVISKTTGHPAQPPRPARKENKTSQQHPQALRPGAVAVHDRRTIAIDVQSSRQAPDSVPGPHTTRKHKGQPHMNYSDYSLWVRGRRDDELHLPEWTKRR